MEINEKDLQITKQLALSLFLFCINTCNSFIAKTVILTGQQRLEERNNSWMLLNRGWKWMKMTYKLFYKRMHYL